MVSILTLYATLIYIFFVYISVIESLYFKNSVKERVYYIFNSDSYNSKIREKKSQYINSYNDLIQVDEVPKDFSVNSVSKTFFDNFFCKESDLVFTNIQESENSNTVLKLNIEDEVNSNELNYLLLIGADKCILESSTSKKIKVVARIIPFIQNTIGNTFRDLECICEFTRNNINGVTNNVFNITCERDDNYVDIYGVENFIPQKVPVFSTIPLTKIRSDNDIETNNIDSRENNANYESFGDVNSQETYKMDFSKLFWTTERSFFGEDEKIELIHNIENQNLDTKKKFHFKDEYRQETLNRDDNCGEREHQLLLDTLFAITSKLIKYLDAK